MKPTPKALPTGMKQRTVPAPQKLLRGLPKSHLSPCKSEHCPACCISHSIAPQFSFVTLCVILKK